MYHRLKNKHKSIQLLEENIRKKQNFNKHVSEEKCLNLGLEQGKHKVSFKLTKNMEKLNE